MDLDFGRRGLGSRGFQAGKVEQAILEILEMSQAGEIFQSDLVRQSGFSKSRVSEVLSSLELRGLISRTPLGRNSRIAYEGGFQHNTRNAAKRSGKVLRLGMIRASEYPFILPLEKILRNRIGVTLRFVFYDNGLDLSRDLSRMRLDLGIAPVLTHFVFYSTGSPIRMIAPAGAGGAAILARSRRTSKRELEVGTTKLSTMELMLRSSIKEGDVPGTSFVSYYQSPRRMVQDLESGGVDAACLWEPYASILLRKSKFERLATYAESDGDHLCCALAAGNHLDPDVLKQISGSFNESLDAYRKNPERYTGPYSKMLNYDSKLVEISSKEYTYPSELNPYRLAKQFEHAGIKIPLPSTVKDSILSAS